MPALPPFANAAPDGPRRRSLVLGGLGSLATAAAAQQAPPAVAAAPARKVLRVAINSAETSFDPARISDLYSRIICAHIFESLYAYDALARPVQVVPRLADGMPEVSADHRVWTVKLHRGIVFADHPLFQGRPRELVAEDVLYAFRRSVDPANKGPMSAVVLGEGIVGLEELRQAALAERRALDYDKPIAGLQALDRYTLRFTLKAPRPRFILLLTQNDLFPAQAREVVEHHGAEAGAHPLGTGPFMLQQWVRGSRIVLVRNPRYREVRYTGQPAPGDTEAEALLKRYGGRRLPMVDEVQVSVIEEQQPLWLSFLNGQLDALIGITGMVPPEFAAAAVPNGRLAPHLARQGVKLHRGLRSDCALMFFNMEDPVVGGTAPDKVALRRAVSLAYDAEREIRLVRRGQAVPAQSPMLPGTTGYDPAFRSSMAEFNPARAKALLDLHGYVDRDGDGWRERPDGQPLVLQLATEPEQIYRLFNEVWQRSLSAVGIRCEFKVAQWPTNLKSAQAGTLQMWMLGSSADQPDGQNALRRWYGPESGQGNLARFRLPAFDALYERLQVLPDGPERVALFREAKRLAAAYMPYKVLVHRIANELMHPWVGGYRRGLFWQDSWHRVDVDMALRAERV